MDLIEVYAVQETKDALLKDRLEQCVGIEVLGLTRSFAVARQQLRVLVPGIVLFNPAVDEGEFGRIRELCELCPQAAVVVLSGQKDSDYVRDCLRAGAQDYLVLPIDARLLQTEIENTYRRSVRRLRKETLSVLMDRFTHKPRLVTFISAKGGVGKTTLAVNTAAALAKMHKKTVLVDLNADMAGTELFLGLHPEYTLSDLAQVAIEEIPQRIMDYVAWHASGLAVLCAPKFTASAGTLSLPLLRVVLQALHKEFQFIVVDLPPVVDSYYLAVMELADECLMVSTPNLAVLTTNQKLLRLFSDLNYETDKVTHVINCVGVNRGVKTEDCERLLQGKARMTVHYDFKGAERATNSGQPVVMGKGSLLAKDLLHVARVIAGATNRRGKAGRGAAAAGAGEAKAVTAD